ncbi:zinc ribbon domain-containing protein [Emticicia fontis]
MEITDTKMASAGNQGILKVSFGVLIGILALLGYLFMGARNETFELQKSLTEKVEQLSSTQIKLDSISKVLDEKIAKINKLGGNIVELKRIKAQLENDKKSLKSDLNFSVQKYSAKIKDYENFLTVKDKEFNNLKEENTQLKARTEILEQEKIEVLTENTNLKSDKETLSQTVAEYSAENYNLQRQVTLASSMKAINVQVAALSSSGKAREGNSFKSSRIHRLRISFIMPSNSIAVKNRKEIYVRILDANGGVISDNVNSGVLEYEGNEIGYSVRQGVLFENNDQKVDIIYVQEAPYPPGKYEIELYCEGFKIGKGGFEVK